MTQTPGQPTLAKERCFNHATREAAARCPVCRRFFCRECVTEHDGRVICAPCLKKISQTATRHSWSLFNLARYAAALAGLSVAWLCFMYLGYLLLLLPSSFHAGTMWGK